MTHLAGGRSFLLGARAGILPSIPQIAGNPAPKIPGDAEAYLATQTGADAALLERMLRNEIKKCTSCGKPNAFTLACCNSCGTSLTEVAISHSTNVFMCFVLGIEKGPFPMKVSARYQDANSLVIDDLLALSPLHFNAIPTAEYIPDWRYLLRNPDAGRAVVDRLMKVLRDTAESQFLSNAEWCAKAIRGGSMPADACVAGFNYPPSQYQLHIQYMAPVLLPFQHYQFQKGVHYTPGRFFPVEYVVACLDAASKAPLPPALLEATTPVEALVAHFGERHGIDYAAMHKATCEKYESSYNTYSNWLAEDFSGMAVEDRATGGLEFLVREGTDAGADSDLDAAAIQRRINDDKTALQNYGRPYDAAGKPTGAYYSFPKEAGAVAQW